jgi:hypothetical protein
LHRGYGEPEYELLAACEEGGSTFAAGGNIPGLISGAHDAAGGQRQRAGQLSNWPQESTIVRLAGETRT